MVPTVVRFAGVPASPWKNGGGSTRELLREPAEGALSLRLSIADVADDGPFSVFPGVDRVLTLLEGTGLRLSGPAGRREIGSEPCAFRGEDPWHCTLVDGPVRDFNVMVSRGTPVRVTRGLGSPLTGSRVFLLALTDGVALPGLPVLDRYDLLVMPDGARVEGSSAGDPEVLYVEIGVAATPVGYSPAP